MKKYLLGIDIGTSACKLAVLDRGGNAVAATSREYPVFYPQSGWAEQNPDDWWRAVCDGLRELTSGGLDAADIAGIGIDGQSWSAIPVDEAGKVLCNTPIWMDMRAEDICRRVEAQIGAEQIFAVSGNPLSPSYTTAKILWYQENRPEVYAQTAKILQSNSFIAYRLSGVISQERSQGYGLHCFDMHTGEWDLGMAEQLGIPARFLPQLYDSHEVVGTVTEAAARETGLVPGTPVVAGGLDAACGTLGAGVIHPGETQEQGGQAGGMSICIDEYIADPRLILSPHVVPGKWLLQGGTTGGGGVMRWLEREFGDYEAETSSRTGKKPLIVFNELAEQIAPGSDGLIFLPYMAGERSPIWDARAKGVYYGLDFAKTKGHFIRAAMEGVAYSLKHNLDVAAAAGAEVAVLRAMGGSANSRLWTQIKADITGKQIIVPSSDMATTLGACILAGVGVGMYESFEEAVALTVKETREHRPNPDNSAVYAKNYQIYRDLYTNLKPIMNRQEEE